MHFRPTTDSVHHLANRVLFVRTIRTITAGHPYATEPDQAPQHGEVNLETSTAELVVVATIEPLGNNTYTFAYVPWPNYAWRFQDAGIQALPIFSLPGDYQNPLGQTFRLSANDTTMIRPQRTRWN